MFLPLSDENPHKFIIAPHVTWGLIVVNVTIFLIMQTLPQMIDETIVLGAGIIPAVVFDKAAIDPTLFHLPTWITPLSSIFLHGGWIHLIGNMLFLFVFGDNVEDAMGHARFLAFYLLCGIVGGFAHAFIMPESQVPLIGASGAISGIIAAYLLLYPRVRVFGLVFNLLPIGIPVWLCLGGWIVFQVANLVFSPDASTAWAAHVGGALAGAMLVVWFKRANVSLFTSARRLNVAVPQVPLIKH